MTKSIEIAIQLIEEGGNARGHFQAYWALANRAFPMFSGVLNHPDYVAFFQATRASHFKSFLLALSKIIDRDKRASGLSNFRKILINDGRKDMSDFIEQKMKPFEHLIKFVDTIRDRSLVHNESDISKEQIYNSSNLEYDQIRDLIDGVCGVINFVSAQLGINSVITKSKRVEKATIKMLEALKR